MFREYLSLRVKLVGFVVYEEMIIDWFSGGKVKVIIKG